MRSVLLVTLVLSSVALADAKHPNPFLSQAKVFYADNDADKCLKRVIQAEKWKYNDKKDRAEIELFGGMCGFLKGDTDAAEVSFKKAVQYLPKLELPANASVGIAQAWVRATGKPLKGELAAKVAAEEKKPEPPAVVAAPTPAAKPQPVLTPPPKSEPDLTIAEAPPKKGRSFLAPALFAGGALIAGGVGTYFGLQSRSHVTAYNDPDTFYADAERLAPQARTEALAANIAFGVCGAFALTALAFLIFGG